MRHKVALGLGAAALCYVAAGIWSASSLPSVEALMGDGKHCPNATTITESIAFQLTYNGLSVAQENMDGSWSIDLRALVGMTVLPTSDHRAWPVSILLAYPFLRHQSFDAANRINTDPKLWRCTDAA